MQCSIQHLHIYFTSFQIPLHLIYFTHHLFFSDWNSPPFLCKSKTNCFYLMLDFSIFLYCFTVLMFNECDLLNHVRKSIVYLLIFRHANLFQCYAYLDRHFSPTVPFTNVLSRPAISSGQTFWIPNKKEPKCFITTSQTEMITIAITGCCNIG